jgi:hypothetical protein
MVSRAALVTVEVGLVTAMEARPVSAFGIVTERLVPEVMVKARAAAPFTVTAVTLAVSKFVPVRTTTPPALAGRVAGVAAVIVIAAIV